MERIRHPFKSAASRGLHQRVGLFSFVLRSEKEEAKVFKRWVTSEVLPSIRRYGSYGSHVQHVIQYKVISMAKPQPSKEERRMLRVGKALSSGEVEQLNAMENIVQLSTWLDSRVRAPNRQGARSWTPSAKAAKWRACSRQTKRGTWCP